MRPLATNSEPSSAKAIGALAVGILIVSAMIWATRPDDGQTAAGTPITVPTTVPTTVPSTVPNERETSSEPVEAEANLLYESVEVTGLIASVVDADVGWIALSIENGSNAGALFRSVDGLNWTALPVGPLPRGDLLGLDRFDDTYVIAVDEARSWSESNPDFEGGGYPDHRISVWTSTDAVNWTPSDLPLLEGNGFPYLVSFTRDSYVVPMIHGEDPDAVLIEFLAPFVDAETAALVCSSRPTFETEIRTVELLDCDGEVLSEVREADFAEDFEDVWQSYCIDEARRQGRRRFQSVFVERGTLPIRVEMSASRGLFPRAVPNGFLSRAHSDSSFGLQQECGGTGSQGAFEVVGLTFWSSGAGTQDVRPTTPVASDYSLGFGASIARGPDDRYHVTMGGSVWSGIAPFDQWKEVLAPPIDGSASGTASRETHLSLSGDGRYALLVMTDTLYVAPLGGDWVEVPFAEPLGFTQIVVATNEYVVVMEQGPRGQRLIKIPLP